MQSICMRELLPTRMCGAKPHISFRLKTTISSLILNDIDELLHGEVIDLSWVIGHAVQVEHLAADLA